MFKGFQKPKRLVANTETLTDRYGMFTAQPFERLSADQAAAIELSAATRQVLPDAQLEVNVVDEPEQPIAKRLVVAVEWRPRPDQPVARVAITSWMYRHEGTEP